MKHCKNNATEVRHTIKAPYKSLNDTCKTWSLQDLARVPSCKKYDENPHQSFLSCFANTSDNLHQNSLSCNGLNYSILLGSALHDNEKNDALKNPISGSLKSAAASRPYILGIDPGITGACALINVDGASPEIVKVWDMPIIEIGKKTRLDVLTLALQVDMYATLIKVCLIEEVGSRPGEGHVGAFSFGFSTGAIHGVVHTCLIPTQTVRPSVWKLELGLTADKQESISRALKYFPKASEHLTLKKHHGRAEALLIAWYAWRKLNVSH